MGWLAHAFGQRYESPVPVLFIAVAAALVVVASFAVVTRRSRAMNSPDGSNEAAADALPRIDSAQTEPDYIAARSGVGAIGWLSLLVTAGLVYAGLAGDQGLQRNILPTTFWILIWVALPLLTGLLGNVFAPWNPFAAIARATDRPELRRALLGTDQPAPWPRRWQWWPVAVLLFAVVLAELVFNTFTVVPRNTAWGLLIYLVLNALGGLIWGARVWCSRIEVFSVILDLWGRLGWRAWRPDTNLASPSLNLAFWPTLSRIVVVLLLLGSVSFDGVLSTPQWQGWVAGLSLWMQPGSAGYALLTAAVFVTLLAGLLIAFGLVARASARIGGWASDLVPALAGLAPSLLPIAWGYLVSHYLQYVLINGQMIFPVLGNPMGTAENSFLPYPFDRSYVPNTGILPTSVLWYLQILIIVAVHVVAVVVAHRRLSASALSPERALRSEWPWLVAMVLFTMLSLWLLAQPLVMEPGAVA